MIPFKYGMIVDQNFFCGREDIIKMMDEFFISSQNVVVHGERRMGKSSLIVEVIRRNKKLNCVFIDLLGVRTEEDVYRRMAKSLLEYYASNRSILDILIKGLSNVKLQIGIDPVTQLPSLSIDTNARFEENSLELILRTIEAINKKDKVVIVLDEFQDIRKINNSYEVLSKLRGKIQHLTDITFVYAGSVRSEMLYIFSDSKSPFFKSAMPVLVEKLDEKVFIKFIKQRFKKGNRKLTKELIELIFESTENVTGDIQQLCEALWIISSYGDTIGVESFNDALDRIFSHEVIAYEKIICNLTGFQQKVLINIAEIGGNEIYSKRFLENGGFTGNSAVTKAVDKLVKTELLFQPLKEYKFVNPFFKMWLRKKFL